MPVFENMVEWQNQRYKALVEKFGKEAMDQARKRCREECTHMAWKRQCSVLPLTDDGSPCRNFKQKLHKRR